MSVIYFLGSTAVGQHLATVLFVANANGGPSNSLVETIYASTVPWSTNSLLTSLFFFCQVNALTCLVLYACWLATSYLHVKYLRLFHLKSLKRELPTFISKERQLLNKATIDYYCVNTWITTPTRCKLALKLTVKRFTKPAPVTQRQKGALEQCQSYSFENKLSFWSLRASRRFDFLPGAATLSLWNCLVASNMH